MNKKIIMLSILFGLTTSTAAIANYQGREQLKQSESLASTSQYYSALGTEENLQKNVQDVIENPQTPPPVAEAVSTKENTESTIVVQAPTVNSTKKTTTAPPSRGGQVPKNNVTQKPSTSTKSVEVSTAKKTSSNVETKTAAKAPTKSTSSAAAKSKVELLDWWKSARSVFSSGTAAEITDVATGKTFKAKRTMGTNHADTEALTRQDTEIIKSIWGGFSWARRPVILNINGRRLAASMSAMPHAGIDSAPAYAVVNNRSDGYGTGENLDVIKGNGMDGHFDIHFLNSTRHKDGKIDTAHQEAIKKAMR